MCRFIEQFGLYSWSCLTSLQSKIFQLLLTNITNIQSVIKKHFEVTAATDEKCEGISVFMKEHTTYILTARWQNKESVYNKNGFLCEYPANIRGRTVTLCWQNLVVDRWQSWPEWAVLLPECEYANSSMKVWMWVLQQQGFYFQDVIPTSTGADSCTFQYR